MKSSIFFTIFGVSTLLSYVSCDVPLVKRSDDVTPLENVVQQQAAMIQTLQSDLAAMKQTQDSMKQQLQSLQSSLHDERQHKQVAFHVHFNAGWQNIQLGNRSTLKFDAVVTNVGGGYNPESGLFTAPVGGIYLFIVGAMTTHDAGELAIMKTGSHVLALTFNAQPQGSDRDRDTAQTVVHLAAGEQVWVQHWYGTTQYKEYWATVFTGVLVESD